MGPKIRKSELLALAIVLLSFAMAYYFYPMMPEKVASHWGASGEVNGYMDPFWGTYFMPVLSAFLLAMFIVIPRIDPLRANIDKFRRHFDIFIVLIMLFMLYIYSLTLAWNLGAEFNMGRMLIPALAVLFYYAGVVLKEARRNWFIGIRTPWTLSSDAVWDKTHKKGAMLFKLFSILILLGLFMPEQMPLIVLAPVLLGSLYLFIYSYLEYAKENAPKGKAWKKRDVRKGK